MGRLVGLLVGLFIYAKTKNILFAGVAGAITWVIVDVFLGSIRAAVSKTTDASENQPEDPGNTAG